MLVYSINLTKNFVFFGQYGIAFMLFAVLLIGGPITGAHYNPAVTIGVYISNKHWKKDWLMFIITIVAQVSGALAGICLVWLSLINERIINDQNLCINTENCIPTDANVPFGEVVILTPGYPYVRTGNAFQIEMICTFIFVMINLIVKTGKTSPTNDGFLACFAVALTLLAMICIAASKTGACLNPAVGIAQIIWEMINFGNNTILLDSKRVKF